MKRRRRPATVLGAILVVAFLAIWVAPRAMGYTVSGCLGAWSQQYCDRLVSRVLDDASEQGRMPPLFLPVLHVWIDHLSAGEGCPLSYAIAWPGGSNSAGVDLGLGGC